MRTGLVKRFDAIFVGNVNAAALAKTGMAKSVRDTGWSSFRTMLLYKSIAAGVWFEKVDARFTTQSCPHYSDRPDSPPAEVAQIFE